MRNAGLSFLALALSVISNVPVQTQDVPPDSAHAPRGAATTVSNSEIEAYLSKMATEKVGDQAIRVVSINGEYNVGNGVVTRRRTSPKEAPPGISTARSPRFITSFPAAACW